MGNVLKESGPYPDYLGLNKMDKARDLVQADEKILYSCKISKQNKFKQWQDRNMLLTNKRLINHVGLEVKRAIDLANIKAIVKVTRPGVNTFMVHVAGEHDYKYDFKRRDELFKLIQEQYKE